MSKTKSVAVPKTSSGGSLGSDREVRMRKISNGYIVSESAFTKKGGYKTRETFTKAPPKIQIKGA